MTKRVPAYSPEVRAGAVGMVLDHQGEHAAHWAAIPSIAETIGREGIALARCTVARLMRTMGVQGVVRGKTVRTTISNAAAPRPLDRINRRFRAPRPDAL